MLQRGSNILVNESRFGKYNGLESILEDPEMGPPPHGKRTCPSSPPRLKVADLFLGIRSSKNNLEILNKSNSSILNRLEHLNRDTEAFVKQYKDLQKHIKEFSNEMNDKAELCLRQISELQEESVSEIENAKSENEEEINTKSEVTSDEETQSSRESTPNETIDTSEKEEVEKTLQRTKEIWNYRNVLEDKPTYLESSDSDALDKDMFGFCYLESKEKRYENVNWTSSYSSEDGRYVNENEKENENENEKQIKNEMIESESDGSETVCISSSTKNLSEETEELSMCETKKTNPSKRFENFKADSAMKTRSLDLTETSKTSCKEKEKMNLSKMSIATESLLSTLISSSWNQEKKLVGKKCSKACYRAVRRLESEAVQQHPSQLDIKKSDGTLNVSDSTIQLICDICEVLVASDPSGMGATESDSSSDIETGNSNSVEHVEERDGVNSKENKPVVTVHLPRRIDLNDDEGDSSSEENDLTESIGGSSTKISCANSPANGIRRSGRWKRKKETESLKSIKTGNEISEDGTSDAESVFEEALSEPFSPPVPIDVVTNANVTCMGDLTKNVVNAKRNVSTLTVTNMSSWIAKLTEDIKNKIKNLKLTSKKHVTKAFSDALEFTITANTPVGIFDVTVRRYKDYRRRKDEKLEVDVENLQRIPLRSAESGKCLPVKCDSDPAYSRQKGVSAYWSDESLLRPEWEVSKEESLGGDDELEEFLDIFIKNPTKKKRESGPFVHGPMAIVSSQTVYKISRPTYFEIFKYEPKVFIEEVVKKKVKERKDPFDDILQISYKKQNDGNKEDEQLPRKRKDVEEKKKKEATWRNEDDKPKKEAPSQKKELRMLPVNKGICSSKIEKKEEPSTQAKKNSSNILILIQVDVDEEQEYEINPNTNEIYIKCGEPSTVTKRNTDNVLYVEPNREEIVKLKETAHTGTPLYNIWMHRDFEPSAPPLENTKEKNPREKEMHAMEEVHDSSKQQNQEDESEEDPIYESDFIEKYQNQEKMVMEKENCGKNVTFNDEFSEVLLEKEIRQMLPEPDVDYKQKWSTSVALLPLEPLRPIDIYLLRNEIHQIRIIERPFEFLRRNPFDVPKIDNVELRKALLLIHEIEHDIVEVKLSDAILILPHLESELRKHLRHKMKGISDKPMPLSNTVDNFFSMVEFWPDETNVETKSDDSELRFKNLLEMLSNLESAVKSNEISKNTIEKSESTKVYGLLHALTDSIRDLETGATVTTLAETVNITSQLDTAVREYDSIIKKQPLYYVKPEDEVKEQDMIEAGESVSGTRTHDQRDKVETVGEHLQNVRKRVFEIVEEEAVDTEHRVDRDFDRIERLERENEESLKFVEAYLEKSIRRTKELQEIKFSLKELSSMLNETYEELVKALERVSDSDKGLTVKNTKVDLNKNVFYVSTATLKKKAEFETTDTDEKNGPNKIKSSESGTSKIESEKSEEKEEPKKEITVLRESMSGLLLALDRLKTKTREKNKACKEILGEEVCKNLERALERPIRSTRSSFTTKRTDNLQASILDLTRIGQSSLYLSWSQPIGDLAEYVEGYEIMVDGRLNQKVRNPNRLQAVLYSLDLDKVSEIHLYAIVKSHPKILIAIVTCTES